MVLTGSSIFCSHSRAALLLVFALAVTACGPSPLWDQPPKDQHIVRSGETLFTIAWRYGKDHHDLARWNKLGDGSLIYPGQVIRLTAPTARTTTRSGSPAPSTASQPPSRPPPVKKSQPPPAWAWPTKGRIVAEYDGQPGSGTGMSIGGRAGQAVRAAAAGRVVYSGGGLIGYGQLIILKHNDTYLSAYGHNASLLVKEGDNIKKGQRIATMGEGPGQEPRLHFEIRRNGKPVNPRQYLPAR
jgi:lipoprotein NlpD